MCSAQAGYIPISLHCVPLAALQGIPVYLRTSRDDRHPFTLYSSADITFGAHQRDRLLDRAVQFIYIAMQDHARFSTQTETQLNAIAADPLSAITSRCEIVYETAVGIMDELLSSDDLSALGPRTQNLARAITTIVLDDATAFKHLFAASHHDFYTSTHMVNVATWMVPLAAAVGFTDLRILTTVCMAGLLHDVGKIFISPEILNRKGRLTDLDWQEIRAHPQQGVTLLRDDPDLDPLILAVTLQHHERLDGSGYPAGLRGDEIHLLSRVCAVTDSFDAMTAYRPYKERTLTVEEAAAVLVSESPTRYDSGIVAAWLRLLQIQATEISQEAPQSLGRRIHQRFPINCPGRLLPLSLSPHDTADEEGDPVAFTATNISRDGIALVADQPFETGQSVRIHLQGGGSLDRSFDALVTRSRTNADGTCEIGARMADIQADIRNSQKVCEK
jgi:HD-GYP domain-containing protein (c-di-GMP phosphodiesterase class II)